MNNKNYVTVIGGANIDITGKPDKKLRQHDSNPGKAILSLGGVGRNISENLARIGVNVEFITALGGDIYANEIKDALEDTGVSTDHSLICENESTSKYLCILDEDGEMQNAIADMDIYNKLTPEYINTKINLINKGEACVVETNVPEETIKYLLQNCTVPVFIDTVSVKKASKIKKNLNGLYAVKANIYEAEILSCTKIKTKADTAKACDIIYNKGVSNVFVSMGKEGVYYKSESDEGLLKSIKTNAVNATGAGDALISGIIMSYLDQFNAKESAIAGICAAAITVESKDTVSKLITKQLVKDKKKNIRRNFKMNKKMISIAPHVEKALRSNKPVVALESTIISHGMPYPQNVETALKVEQIVKDNGAVPATIAIINGVPTVGISEEQIEHLGKKGLDVTKASRRDIPVLAAKKEDGATTVASTMIIAAMAGIKVFATGGIGGVHRGAEKTMDISADLEELARTNVAVVCAGAKSILDLGLTMEYLETKGVPVIGYKTDALPAFFTRESDFKVNYRMDEVKEISDTIISKYNMNIDGSVLIANPIPEEFAMDKDYIDGAIKDAVKEAEKLGIMGKDATPFLLDKIKKITQGKSLEANIELVFNNVKLGAQIANEMCKRLA